MLKGFIEGVNRLLWFCGVYVLTELFILFKMCIVNYSASQCSGKADLINFKVFPEHCLKRGGRMSGSGLSVL